MQISFLGSVAVSLAFTIACSTHGQEPRVNAAGQSPKATIAHLENRWGSALNNADISTIGAILADDFVRPAPATGTFITKAQLLAYYRSHLSPHSGITRRIQDMTVSVEGTTGIARGIVITTSTDHERDTRRLFTDVFILRSGHWQALSAQENRIPR